MAGIISNVDSDVQKLRKLKNEIEEVKKALKSINIKVDINIAEGLQSQLKSLTVQYNELVNNIAQAEAKILLSAKKINDASEKIIQAQEKMAKTAGTPTQIGSTKSQGANAVETASIQVQAKAYEDLKAEINGILGTREANVKRMVDEMNAIRLINAEIKKITKSQGESASLSSAQQKRLEQLNNSLLTHKTALSEVRQTLNNNVKLDNAAATSMNGLSQSLSRMRIAYRELTEEERNSPIGKELLASINQADAKIKELDATIGNHQRNVGNYGNRWNGLSMSIQQVGRELPSLAYGPKVFFSAISNNLPILADEIKRARTEYELLKKSGQTATPVWKQVLSSLFSWQTALTVGITLLTLYGDKVVDWVSGLFKATDAIKSLKDAEHDINEKFIENTKVFGQQIVKLRELQEHWKSLGNNIDAQKKFIQDAKTDFNNLGASVNTINDAESLLVKNTPAFIEALKLRAQAAAAKELSEEKYKEYLSKRQEALNESQKKPSTSDKLKRLAYNLFEPSTSGVINTKEQDNVLKSFQGQRIKGLMDEAEAAKADAESYFTLKQAKEEAATEKINSILPNSKTESFNKEYWEKLKKDTQAQLVALSDVEAAGKKGLALKQKIAEYDKKINAFSTNITKQAPLADKLRQEQEKYKLLVSKQELERIRQQQDLENQVSRSKIDAMEAGFEKEQAQRELNNKLEIQSIQRQKEDYIQAAIKAQKDLFDAQEELKAKQNKGYIKKSFDPSSVSVDTSAFDTIISNTSKRQQNDKVRSQEEAWNEYLLKFGNYQQKRQAIIEKYDKQIKEAGPAGDAAILEKNKQNALDELDNSVMNSTTLMGQLFADASQKSVGEIQKIIDRAELLIDYLTGTKDEEGNITIGGVAYNDVSIAKTVGISGNTLQNLQSSPEEVEAFTNAIRNLKSELGAKSPFKLFETQIEDAVKKIKSGGKDSMAQGIADIGNAIVSFSPAIKQFGSDLASIFGEELSGDIANVIDGVSGLGQTAAGIGQIMSGDIVGGVMGVVGGISQVVNAMGSLFGPDGTAYYEGIKEQLEAINSVYDKIIDKSKEDIVFGGGFSSIEAASTALDNYEKKLLNLQKIADASGRAGASWKSHSAEWHSNKNVGAGDFGQMSRILGKSIKTMDDLYYLTGEELYLVMSQMPEAWSRIDGRIRENLESIVACKDEAKELKDALNEAMTGIDQDSFYNGFIDQLSDMDTSFEDMCDNFEGYLRKSIIAGLIASQYKTRIDGLYEQWSEAAKSDKEITGDESDILRQKYKEIIEDMMKDREQMAKDFGWDSSSSSQSATKKGFATASQDSIDELNGRFTAGQIAWEETKNQSIKQTDLLSSINEKISLLDLTNEDIPKLTTNVPDIAGQSRDSITGSYRPQINIVFPDGKIEALTAEVSTLKGIVNEMRTLQVEGNLDMQEIREGVQVVSKNSPKVLSNMDEIKRNIKKL